MSSVIKNFLVTFFLSLVIFGLLAYGIIQGVGKIFSGDQPGGETDSPGTGISAGRETTESTGADSLKPLETIINDKGESIVVEPEEEQSDRFSILLVGTDYQPDVHADYDLSEYNASIVGFGVKPRKINADAMVLVRFDQKSKTIAFLPLPAKMRVSVGGIYTDLSAVYQSKGIEYLCEEVKGLTGIRPDYYAVADIPQMAAIIDELGGVNFTVPVNMYYEDPSEELEIRINRGSQTLDGETAVKMLRYVSYADGDDSRRALIVSFLEAVLNTYTEASFMTKASSTYTALSLLAETNFTAEALAEHLELIFSYSSLEKKELTYPVQSMGDYLEPKISEAIRLLEPYR